jgi:hypothetical protein
MCESVVVFKDAATTCLYGSRGLWELFLLLPKKVKGEHFNYFNSSYNVGTVNRLPIIKMNMPV